MVGAVGIELKATLKARKFRTPDMVSRKRVRFLPPDERARPNNACEGEYLGTGCLSCLAPRKEPRGLVTDVAN